MTNRCRHDGPSRRVCAHLSADPDADELDYVVLIEGHSTDYALICLSCRDLEPSTIQMSCLCEDCFAKQEAERYWDEDTQGVIGTFEPRIIDNIEFQTVCVGKWEGGADTLGAGYAQGWVLCGQDAVFRLGHDGNIIALVQPAELVSWLQKVHNGKPALSVDMNGRFAALIDADGGIVWDLASGEVILRPSRDDYHSKQTAFPIAFVRRDERDFVVYACAWNELELFDLTSKQVCTLPPAEADKLDYFFGALHVSPEGTRMASTGWVWAPVGIVGAWDLAEWQEKPLTRQQVQFLAQRSYYWDGPCVWLDETRLAIWGFGNDDLNLVDAVCVYDSQSGELKSIVPGVPSGRLTFDGTLLHCASATDGISVWNMKTGMRTAHHGATHAIHDSSGSHVLAFGEDKFTILRLRPEL